MHLPEALKAEIFALAGQLLDVIDQAGSTERALFEYYDENAQTLEDLQVLGTISNEAQDLYRRLTGLMPGLARDPPEVATAKMNLLEQTMQRIVQRLAASRQSVYEVQQFWSLP